MTNNNSLFVCDEESDDIVILHYKPRDETQRAAIPLKQRIVTWFGALLTITWGVAAFAPAALHISAAVRPWIFVTYIFWIIAYCAGIFNS